MELGEREPFTYDGQLVFNGIYTTKIINSNLDFQEVISNDLTNFSDGSIDNPGHGYQVLPFSQFMEDTSVSPKIERELGEIHGFRYLEEIWEYHEVAINGSTENRPTLAKNSSFDAYWAYPDYLFIKGNKTETRKAEELVQYALDDYIQIKEISFHPEFLLWLFSKEKNGDDLPGSISINMLTDAEISGESPDLLGQHSKVTDSIDITKSALVLIGVLQQKGLVALEGVFEIGGQFVRARISTDGRIHIKADHAIKGSSDFERIILSLAFMRNFTGLYQYWEDLDAENRYPPVEFFIDLYNECDRQGIEINFSIDDVIGKFREKGSTEEYEQYQSGLADFNR